MIERTIQTAAHLGLLEKLQMLESSILQIPGIPEVDFDIDGFLDNIPEVIMIPRYSIPASDPEYYKNRRALLVSILQAAAAHDLTRTEDRIEDMGEHFYIVTRGGDTWKN